MCYVYIIQSDFDNSYYIGHTLSIEDRVWEHNVGRTRYTKSRRPWILKYTEAYPSKGEAIKRERYLKKLKSKVYLEQLIRAYSSTG